MQWGRGGGGTHDLSISKFLALGLSSCCLYSLEQQMCKNPQLKTVPHKCTIYCSVQSFLKRNCKVQNCWWGSCDMIKGFRTNATKTFRLAVFFNYMFDLSSVGTSGFTVECHWRSREVESWQTNLFKASIFHEICWQQEILINISLIIRMKIWR